MEYIDKLKRLSEKLSTSKKVNSFNSGEERECDTLAHSLMDMNESFNIISNNLLPKLSSGDSSEEEIENILFEIGEELRHILYHIKDPQYFRYIIEDATE